LQLSIGVLVFNETFDRARAIGFVFIWIGLAIFAIDGAVRARRRAPVVV
jgi:chloramphenicol-sensitive protein RarD